MPDASPEEKLLALIKKAQGRFKLKGEIRVFTKVNLILIVLMLGLTAVFLKDILTPQEDADAYKLELLTKAPAIPEDAIQPEEDVYADIDYETPERQAVLNEDISKNLNLLGIITGDENQAIIEDREKQKTFFLHKGDTLGKFEVYDIKENAVVLDYEGERIELKM